MEQTFFFFPVYDNECADDGSKRLSVSGIARVKVLAEELIARGDDSKRLVIFSDGTKPCDIFASVVAGISINDLIVVGIHDINLTCRLVKQEKQRLTTAPKTVERIINMLADSSRQEHFVAVVSSPIVCLLLAQALCEMTGTEMPHITGDGLAIDKIVIFDVRLRGGKTQSGTCTVNLQQPGDTIMNDEE